MAGRQREKVVLDEVHHNQILRELYLKELRTQKLYTEYHVNPLRKVHTITRKPMSWHDNLEEPADARFLNLIHHAAQGPRKKYPETQTESQEIGWDSEPLVFLFFPDPLLYQVLLQRLIPPDNMSEVNPERDDRRLNHFRVYNDITLYKAKLWSLGEDNSRK
ncbi:protein FAM183A isoform X1 [Elephas maximus indicus]|uniref:protein FAM183A isoform X1 n=1 Tax=Elephas maximus indicus TaxID=99487 RepID=UPI0021168E56|nr:protein FAM183A isoform X1 [Elephas maximus indicus]